MYLDKWRERRKILIVSNLIFLVLGICAWISDHDMGEAFWGWLLGSWLLGTLLSMFSKNGGKLAELVHDMMGVFFTLPLAGGGVFFALIYVVYATKAFVGIVIFGALLLVGIVSYPFTTVYYFIKSRKLPVIGH